MTINKKITINLDEGFIEIDNDDGETRKLDGKGLGICRDVQVVHDGIPRLQIEFAAEEIIMIKKSVRTEVSLHKPEFPYNNQPLHMEAQVSPELTPKRLEELAHMEEPCTCTHFAEPHTMGWH